MRCVTLLIVYNARPFADLQNHNLREQVVSFKPTQLQISKRHLRLTAFYVTAIDGVLCNGLQGCSAQARTHFTIQGTPCKTGRPPHICAKVGVQTASMQKQASVPDTLQQVRHQPHTCCLSSSRESFIRSLPRGDIVSR